MDGTTAEQKLWIAFQRGDEEAYTLLYKQHIKAMYRYGMSLIPVSEAFVLDCIHDVFTEIWVKREKLIIPDNVRHYLLKSLKNRILHLLKRKERPSQPLPQDDFDDLWTEPSAEDLFLEKESSANSEALLKKLIVQLPHRQQEALRLRFVENLDYGQIADMLSVNRQSAQNLVFRAVDKLRKWLL